MTIFVLTGRCPGYEPMDLADRLARHGHILYPKMTRIGAANGAILVASDEAVERNTSKVNDARLFGAPVWSYSRLLSLLAGPIPERRPDTIQTRIDTAVVKGIAAKEAEIEKRQQLRRLFPEEPVVFTGRTIKRSL